jgi:hypothetical protein
MPSGEVRVDPQAGHRMIGGSSSMGFITAVTINSLSHEGGESEMKTKGNLILCEWQDSNLRTPARIDLESITVGRLVTLAPNVHYRKGDLASKRFTSS